MAPLAHSVHQIVAGLAVDQGRANVGITEHPGMTHIVCKHQNGVKLVLGHLQGVFDIKAVDGFDETGQMLGQHLLRFRHGNAVTAQPFQFRSGAGRTVTNGPLGIVPTGITVKTFQHFEQGDHLFAGLQDRNRRGRNRPGRHQTQQQHNRQSQTNQTFHFYRPLLSCIVTAIIPFIFKLCKHIFTKITLLLLFCFPKKFYNSVNPWLFLHFLT